MTEALIQGSEAWHLARLGKVTASRVADVIARTKSGPAASRKTYLAELVAERLTGQPADSYRNPAMVWGLDTEPQARAAYEFFRDEIVEEVGFIAHPTIALAGASPDGLVGHHGMVEIKCPNTATHIDTLLTGAIAGRYVTQMQWQMACADRRWCDYVSFDPRMPIDLQLFVKPVQRDEAAIRELETAVTEFLAELDAKVAALRTLGEAA